MRKSKSRQTHFSRTLFSLCKKLFRHPIPAIAVCVCLVLLFTTLGLSSAFHKKSRMTSFGMKNIGELATQSGFFTVVNVMGDNVKLWEWNVPLTASQYICSYDGVVKAGLDFSELDYLVNELKKEITVFMPEVKLLSVEIQEDSLEIYDESHNIFSPLGLVDIQQARLEMISEIQDRALENGLLDQATVNAQELIRSFLATQYDFNEYHLVFEDIS